jgi:hypothetical protein
LRGGLLGTVMPAVGHGLRYIGSQIPSTLQRRLQPDASDPRILYGALLSLSLAAMTTPLATDRCSSLSSSHAHSAHHVRCSFVLIKMCTALEEWFLYLFTRLLVEVSIRLFPLFQPILPSNQAGNACDPSTRLSGVLLSHDCSCFDDVVPTRQQHS